ncbi:hypothetical protein RN001_000839 [Aquatica leii]|uniref:Uncharacterized protein n=1 Tax=Aquatica leii TaxID=1421715 RepID=A0AAN7QM93_9COLE|nr:hypothetical protein RN001_000839 [Aquatica leii]
MDKNIDESIRKPRRSKGTPFFKQRNYYALGFLGLSAITAVLFEFWGQSKKLKNSLLEGKFDYPVELKERIIRQKWSNDPGMTSILKTLDEKKEQEQYPKKQSYFVEMLQKVPDL